MNFLEMNGLQTAQTHFKDIFQSAIALENRGKTVKAAGGRCEKITCAECGRRRFGYTYEVTGWPTHRKKEDKLT